MTNADPRRDLDALAKLPSESLWLRPIGFVYGSAAAAAIDNGAALPLAGGEIAFSHIEMLFRPRATAVPIIASPSTLHEWRRGRADAVSERIALLLDRLSAARSAWAGFVLDRPLLIGIVNATPDSFSDGGDFLDPARAIAQGRALLEAGADIVDVGGESTRPGAAPVPPEEEIRRVEPVIRGLAEAGAVVSIDTRHARVMAAALSCSARIVNDVSALTGDPDSLGVVARTGAPVILMHMQGEPRTMQQSPHYDLASLDVLGYLDRRLAACELAGIARDRIALDPGIGFGKHSGHNLEILARIGMFHALGRPILLGLSRKGLAKGIDYNIAPKDRLPGSLAGSIAGVAQGVQILRVHDVAATRQALMIWRAAVSGA